MMPDDHFHIALSHGVLAGTGIYCLFQLKGQDFFCPHITFSLFALNNIVAICRWGTNYNSPNLGEIYRFTSYCQVLFALPCITTTVWLSNGYNDVWSWIWVIIPVFPLFFYVTNADEDMRLADLLIIFNLLALGVVSVAKELNYGIASTITYAFSHMLFRNRSLYNYGLCFFAYFALRAVGFGHDLF